MADFVGSAYGITKEEHDQMMLTRTRPLTDRHPGKRLGKTAGAAPDVSMSLLERIMQKDDAE